MKAKNLQILKENGFNVPSFIVVEHEFDLTPIQMFILGNKTKFAVRSSFEIEDGIDASFAGQFKTLLNVDKKDLKEAVRNVKDSLLEDNVREYCESNNINMYTQCNKVIIQEMIDSDCSGVVFTANPMGCLNETVIVVGEGLGCNIVEDKVNTTSYFYNQDDKVYRCVSQEKKNILSENILQELINISDKIKKIFGKDMDIEFAIKDGIVYILQARPITTISYDNLIVLDNSNIVESYPGVSLPLTQDFVKQIYSDIFTNLCLRMTKNEKLIDEMKPYLANMIECVNWRVYYNISHWYVVLKLLPFSNKIIPMWQKMMGVTNTNFASPKMKVSIGTKMQIMRCFLRCLQKTPDDMKALWLKFANNLSGYEKNIQQTETVSGLLETYHIICQDILSDWDITLANDMYTFIYTALSGDKNKEKLADIKNLCSMLPVKSVENLVWVAYTYGFNSKEYLNEKEKHIDRYGDRCLCELKLETKTYRTNPELLDEYIQKQLECVDENNPPQPCFYMKDRRPRDPSIKGVVKKAHDGISWREASRLDRSRIFGLCREIFLKIGEILVKNGNLNQKEDIFYLHMHEINEHTNFIDLVESRKKMELTQLATPVYNRLVFNDEIIPLQPSDINLLSTSNTLSGIGTSVGEVTGEVLVIDIPDDKIDTSGKILVTKSTDPGWIFLIKNAAGIIAEKGSLLSHTAIVSRELHKPAVVNVRDCTKILKTGDIVKLNANEGTVTILKE